MSSQFDSFAYVLQVGKELVSSFEAGGFATTPGQVGSARETPVREKLSQLLPRGMGVGSGCVIDTFGHTSKQMDIVLYERDVSPIFVVNNDAASTYYPCEGVIAVGEIKSVIDTRELGDIFGKIESVKKLRRFTRQSPSGFPNMPDYVAFRQYGSLSAVAAPRPKDYNQAANSLDQIYGFALTGRIALSLDTLCDKFIELARSLSYSETANLIVALDGGVLCPLSIPTDRENPSIAVSFQDANSLYSVQSPNKSFPFLLARLQSIYFSGRTVETLAFERYLVEDGVLTLPPDGAVRTLPALRV